MQGNSVKSIAFLVQLRHNVGMKEDEIGKITEFIENLKALEKSKEEYYDSCIHHSRTYLGLSPFGITKTLGEKMQLLTEEVLFALVDVEDCIAEYSKPEDGLVGYFIPPTGVFARDLICDVRYAIKSKKHKDTNTLIQQLKIVQKRVKKSAETGQGNMDTKREEKSRMRKSKNGEKTERGVLIMSARSSKENWEAIKSEYGISKREFGKKINFVSDSFKKKIIFRDAEHAFVLATHGFSKPALILAGGVIEELLRLYLEYKKIKPKDKNFVSYIKACEDNKLLKRGVSRLTDSVRDFRNLVHLSNEKTSRDTILKPAAKGAVASIFTIANDFQKVLSN
jgi:hypothetical protein